MKFVVKRLSVAEEDALEAALWYEAREAGLGDDFQMTRVFRRGGSLLRARLKGADHIPALYRAMKRDGRVLSQLVRNTREGPLQSVCKLLASLIVRFNSKGCLHGITLCCSKLTRRRSMAKRKFGVSRNNLRPQAAI